MRPTPLLALLVTALPAATLAETLLRIDARAPVPTLRSAHLAGAIGAARAPSGTTLGINNRFLTLDGKPWTPIMGELHFTRLPPSEWDAALAKLKASGVDIVATYVFWIFHEETAGAFNWAGDRNLRAFVQAAARHDLKVFVRIGPWAHGEARFGGIPDWAVNRYAIRSNDPAYLGKVERFWTEIAGQLKGLFWKDGGPIIGTQLENEYNLTGPGRGREHIAALKKMAVRLGFDTPYYTVTGWDRTIYPKGQVVPVFGGYPDEPWSRSTTELPPKETYAFRFDSRVSGDLGAQTQGNRAPGDAEGDMDDTPFLGAEYGGGVPSMYRRRPLLTGDDIAAMLPVQLGSGVNLYGYYMFHGGRNPAGRGAGPLVEQTATGGYNDMPLIDYDFQAPFGAYGEPGPALGAIRPFHHFIQAFGATLAPMPVRKPDRVPADARDLVTPRLAVRSAGDRGFLFMSNHVRQYPMAAQADVRFSVDLPGGTLRFPSTPVTVPNGAYFIWPFNLDLGAGANLAWATVQPVTRITTPDGPLLVLSAVDGIPVELSIDATRVTGGRVAPGNRPGRHLVTGLKPGTGGVVSILAADGTRSRILVLTQAQSRRLWRVPVAGGDRLLLSDDELVDSQNGLTLLSRGDPAFDFALFPAPAGRVTGAQAGRMDGLFRRYAARVPARSPRATLRKLHPAQSVPAIRMGGAANYALEPHPEVFGRAAGWTIDVPANALTGLDDAFLRIDFKGDVARLFEDDTLLDDRYYDGRTWSVGLSRFASHLGKPLTLTVLPLRGDAPIYIDKSARPKLAADAQIAEVEKVEIVPQYRLNVRFD